MIDEFYSTPSIDDWKKVTGKDLHYHHGYYDIGNEDQVLAQQNSIRRLYPYIKNGSSVLDLGCGWSSVGKLLRKENNNMVRGITISKQQADYSNDVDLLNLDEIKSEEIDNYDVGIMIESIEHVSNYDRLFNILRNKVKRLIICANLSSGSFFNSNMFGESCKPHTLSKIINSLEKNLFQVNMIQNYRHKTVKSYEHWLDGLNKGVQKTPQFDALFNYCSNFKGDNRLQSFLPIYLIVADRNKYIDNTITEQK